MASLPQESWTFVPIPGMSCANDTPTGIGVNPTSRSKNLYIYMEGGGGCWSPSTCSNAFHVENANLHGFGAAQLQQIMVTGAPQYVPPIPPGHGQSGVFDRTTDLNPFQDYSYVYIPYCTADMHRGDSPHSPITGLSHVGYVNMTRALAYLAAAFPPAPGRQVVLGGGSAGAFGALWNFPQAHAAFAPTPVMLLTESGPPLPQPYLAASIEDAWEQAWDLDRTLPPGAPSTKLYPFFQWVTQAYPAQNKGFIAMTGDVTIAAFFGIPLIGDRSLSDALSGLQEDARSLPRTSFFLIWGVLHSYLFTPPQDWPAHWPPPLSDGETLGHWISSQISPPPSVAVVEGQDADAAR